MKKSVLVLVFSLLFVAVCNAQSGSASELNSSLMLLLSLSFVSVFMATVAMILIEKSERPGASSALNITGGVFIIIGAGLHLVIAGATGFAASLAATALGTIILSLAAGLSLAACLTIIFSIAIDDDDATKSFTIAYYVFMVLYMILLLASL